MTIFYIYFLSKCEEGTKVYVPPSFVEHMGDKSRGGIFNNV